MSRPTSYYRRKESAGAGIFTFLFILGLIGVPGWGGARVYRSIVFDKDCKGHLKRAADAVSGEGAPNPDKEAQGTERQRMRGDRPIRSGYEAQEQAESLEDRFVRDQSVPEKPSMEKTRQRLNTTMRQTGTGPQDFEENFGDD